MNSDKFQKPPIQTSAESLSVDVSCELLTLELADKYQGHARLLNAGSDARDAVVYLHGIQSHGGWFLGSADYLRQHGVTVFMPDRRGSGLNRQQRGHAKNSTQLLGDLDRCVDFLRQNTCRNRVDLVAVSWSGKLALAYAARQTEKIRKVVLVAPGLCSKIDIHLTEKIAVGIYGVIHPRKLHTIPLTEPSLFTANPPKLAFITHDPLMLREATASFFITSRLLDGMVRRAVPRLRCPVFLFLAGKDRIIDNAATVDLLHPALTPVPEFTEPARLYPNAHHTLDFEPNPSTFYNDLLNAIIS